MRLKRVNRGYAGQRGRRSTIRGLTSSVAPFDARYAPADGRSRRSEPPHLNRLSLSSATGLARNPGRSRQRDSRHCSRLYGQGNQVLALKMVNVLLAAGSRHHREFHIEGL